MKSTLLKIAFKMYLYAGVVLLVSAVLAVAAFLIRRGLFALKSIDADHTAFETLTNIVGDLWPSIAGTFLITASAVIIAVPVGVITAVFINEYSRSRTRELYVFLFKLIASIPSIVIGVFGFVLLLTVNSLFDLSLKTSFIVAALSLSMLILPYIVHSTILALKQVPHDVRIAAQSLGAKRYQNIFRVLLPQSFASLSSGVILAIGRACEDTAVIMLTGAAAYAGIPNSLTSSFEALPYYIYYHTAEYQDQYELTGVFIATIIIVCISSFFMVTATVLKNKINSKLQ